MDNLMDIVMKWLKLKLFFANIFSKNFGIVGPRLRLVFISNVDVLLLVELGGADWNRVCAETFPDKNYSLFAMDFAPR